MSDSLAKGIADVYLYGATWKEVGAQIRIDLITTIIKSLVDIAVQQAQAWIVEQITHKQRQANIIQEGTTEVTMENAKTTAVTATAVAENAAGSAKSGMIATLVGEGAEVATSWAPAAAMVSAATFGANAIPATLGLLAVGAATVAAMAMASAGGLAVSSGATGGTRAQGGSVEKDKSYLVGELGKEAFIPDQQGFVLSHSKLKQFEHDEPKNNVYDINTASGFGSDIETLQPEPFAGVNTESEEAYTNITVESPYESVEPSPDSTPSSSPLKDDDSEGSARDKFEIYNIVDPALVKDYLETDDGEKVIVNIMRRNEFDRNTN